MSALNEQNNFLYLTACLLILLVAAPVANIFPQGFAYWILKAITTVTIITGYLSLNFGPLWRRFTGVLLLLMIVSGVMREQFQWAYAHLFDLKVCCR